MKKTRKNNSDWNQRRKLALATETDMWNHEFKPFSDLWYWLNGRKIPLCRYCIEIEKIEQEKNLKNKKYNNKLITESYKIPRLSRLFFFYLLLICGGLIVFVLVNTIG